MDMKVQGLLLFGVLVMATMPPETCGKVLEVDDRIIEFTAQGKWLVTFYAPWCGHCRKLEPVMDEVATILKDKNTLSIAKIDATRYHKSASHFDVKAYPTIKFINGDKVIDYHGERRKSDIMEFITKAESPRITKISSQNDFEQRKMKYTHFFLLVTPTREADSNLKKEFYELANKYYLDAYFFHATPEQVNQTIGVLLEPEWPLVLVMKEREYFQYDAKRETLLQFVRNERFLTFTEITMSNFHNLIETRKMLAILNLNSNDKPREKQTKKLLKNFDKFSKENRHINHNDFLFGYVDNSDLLNGIAIWTLQTPLLIVLNTSSYTYSMFDVIDTERKELLDLDIQDALDMVKFGSVEVFGGQSYFRTLRRPLWELYRAIVEMFYEAPLLSLLIFGFPFAVISIVFYFLCCVDSNDPADEDEMNSEISGSEMNDEDEDLDDQQQQVGTEQGEDLCEALTAGIQNANIKKDQ